MLPDILHRVVVRLAARAVRRELELAPAPDLKARQLVPGPDADRVLIVGNGSVRGYGVRTHDLAPSGRLAQALGARTARGIVVDARVDHLLSLDELPSRLARERLRKYDVVVLAVGAVEAAALLPGARWTEQLDRLLDHLEQVRSSGTEVVLLAASPVVIPGHIGTFGIAMVDRRAAELDRFTALACAARDGFTFLPPAAGPIRRGNTAEDHQHLADRIADCVEPLLDGLASRPSATGARAQRNAPDAEAVRQAALDRSRLLEQHGGEQLERLLAIARQTYHTVGAAVTLVDADRMWCKAAIGLPADELPRSAAACAETIAQDGVLVHTDLDGHPLGVWGWRFYAGYPLESPEGLRIGTLCVLDDRPRTGEPIDPTALAELANRVQHALWAEMDTLRTLHS